MKRMVYLVVYDVENGFYDAVMVGNGEALTVFRSVTAEQLQRITEEMERRFGHWYLIKR